MCYGESKGGEKGIKVEIGLKCILINMVMNCIIPIKLFKNFVLLRHFKVQTNANFEVSCYYLTVLLK